MGRPIIPKGGNDNVDTPVYLAKKIVGHFKPSGKILEPCAGKGNFLRAVPMDTCKNFLTVEGHWNWIVTNPPYSQYRAFLNKAMEVADNIVFLQLINAIFYKARLRDTFQKGFGIKEIWPVDTPKEFPQFGLQLGCVYFKKGYKGNIKFKRV